MRAARVISLTLAWLLSVGLVAGAGWVAIGLAGRRIGVVPDQVAAVAGPDGSGAVALIAGGPGAQRLSSSTRATEPTTAHGDGEPSPSQTARHSSSSSSSSSSSGSSGSSEGVSWGAYADRAGQIRLACSASGISDWRILPAVGWTARAVLLDASELWVVFVRETVDVAVSAGCKRGRPVIEPMRPTRGLVSSGNLNLESIVTET